MRLIRHRRPLAIALLAVLLVAAGPTDDPLSEEQWHLGQVRAPAAWPAGTGGGVVVAVLDTGVASGHPDLQGRLVEGIDLVEEGTPPDDENGHGTIVAGIIAAVTANASGVAGVAPDALVMPVRVLDAQGTGSSDKVAEGIRYAVDRGATVVNLSLADAPAEGGEVGIDQLVSGAVVEAIREADQRGAVVVAAAGNDGRERTPYADDVPVLVVGATDRSDAVWPQSNRDPRTLFAPGVGIVSTHTNPSGYAMADGTSFATPVVAAGAALLLGQGLGPSEVRERLTATALPVGVGLGRIDLAAAAGVSPPPPAPPPPPPPPPAAPGDVRQPEPVVPVIRPLPPQPSPTPAKSAAPVVPVSPPPTTSPQAASPPAAASPSASPGMPTPSPEEVALAPAGKSPEGAVFSEVSLVEAGGRRRLAAIAGGLLAVDLAALAFMAGRRRRNP